MIWYKFLVDCEILGAPLLAASRGRILTVDASKGLGTILILVWIAVVGVFVGHCRVLSDA